MPDPLSSPASRNLHQATTMYESCPEDACIDDMDDFIKALTTLTSKDVQPEFIGSILSHYATKWLPQFSQHKSSATTKSPTSSWIKKRFFIQTLIDFLPQENQTITCTFLLKLLKTANMLAIESTYVSQIEKRVALQLHQATIKELMIPSFDHTCVTLLDIELFHRLVVLFMESNESFEANKSCSALTKVAKLVDLYLAEAATDANLTLTQFIDLASALPHQARAAHDGLYRAIDTYLKAHPGMTKQERRTLCNMIDSQKLSQEAAIHAARNERLPVRSVIQVLFSEQSKITHQLEWSGSFSGARSSPMMPMSLVEPATRCHSKRVTSMMMMMSPEQFEMRRLKEEVVKLQRQCDLFQEQMNEMKLEKKKSGFFKWRKFSLMRYFWSGNEEKVVDVGSGGRKNGEVGTPMVVRGRTPSRWRKSSLY